MNYEVNVHELFWLTIAEASMYNESVSFDLKKWENTTN